MTKTEKALKTIAKREGISVAEVKKEMQLAINEAYIKPNFYAKCVSCKGAIPTVEEFIEYSVRRVELVAKQK